MTQGRVTDVERPLPFASATRAVLGLSLDGMLWSRRSLIMGLLLALPIGLALLHGGLHVSGREVDISGYDLYALVVAVYYVRNLLPLTALFYASALIADEVEGRTLTYLVTRPVPRSAVLVGKYLAYLATTLTLTLPPIVVTFFLLATGGGEGALAGRVVDLFRDLGVAALALLAYGALFTLAGVALKRPVIPGLLFLFGWELVANLPGYLPRLTVTAYLRSLVAHRPPVEGLSGLFGQTLPAGWCLAVLAVITAAGVGAAAWLFSAREYVLEQ